jgi:7-cyano-7-deazaguanine tRNA-ribosyltransferase
LFKRYQPLLKNTVVLPEGGKPYSVYYSEQIKKILDKESVNILVDSNLGPVPLELDEMYPFAQSVFPEYTDEETEQELSKIFEKFTKNNKIICWKGNETLKEIKGTSKKRFDEDIQRISAVSDMQFGKGAGKTLFAGDIKIVKSKKTGKIRNIYGDGKHILSMRAGDGMFTLKMDGAKLLHKSFKHPSLRVVVKKDAVPFVKEGKSVFAKFVKDCDSELRPSDECLIVDEKDNLLAAGRCLLNRFEMLSFDYGMAVKTREHR